MNCYYCFTTGRLPLFSDAGLIKLCEQNQRLEYLDIYRVFGNGTGLKALPPTMKRVILQQMTPMGKGNLRQLHSRGHF